MGRAVTCRRQPVGLRRMNPVLAPSGDGWRGATTTTGSVPPTRVVSRCSMSLPGRRPRRRALAWTARSAVLGGLGQRLRTRRTRPAVTVLILAGERDVRADRMVCALGDRGMPVFRADLGWFPQQLTLDAELRDKRWVGRLVTPHREVALEELRSVWYRSPSTFRFPCGPRLTYRITADDQSPARQ